MSKATILIVEDEAIVAADLAGKLGQLGYEVIGIAARGEEAIDQACSLQPQVVLMDIRLKSPMDGIEAAETIRRRINVPVIYLTAYSDPATLERAKLSDPFGYILKPFEERELATTIEMAIYKHQSDRQLREQQEWLRVTLASIGDAVITCDTAGRVTFLNPVAEALTGWSIEEARDLPIGEVFHLINEQTRQPSEDIVPLVLKEGCTKNLANHTALVTRDGREIPIENSASPILANDSKVIGAVFVFHDVTEKRHAQEAMRKAHDAMEIRVEKRTQELKELNDTLEERIIERTAQLKSANESLLASRVAALNLMEDAVITRKAVEETSYQLQLEIEERKRAEEATARRNALLTGINTIFKEALTCKTDEELAEACLKVAEELTGSSIGFVGEIGADGLLHDIAISDMGWDACAMYDNKGQQRPAGSFHIHGIYGRVLLDGKPLYTNDPTSHPDSIGIPEKHPALSAFLGVPLKSGGKTIGMIAVGNRDGGYNEEELETLEALAPSIVESFQRKRAEQALRESELFYSQTLESIPGMVFTTRPDGYCDYQNRQWAEFTGVPITEHLGDGWNNLLHPDDRSRAFAAWHAAVEERAAYDLEYRVRRHDGEYEWFKVIGRPIRDTAGQIVKWFGVAVNIDANKRVEEQLLQAKEAAEVATQAKSQFLANMSHELRTPMTGVLGMLELALDESLGQQQRQTIELAHKSAHSLLRILNDVLDLTKAEAGKLSMEENPFALRECVSGAVDILISEVRRKGLELAWSLADDLPNTVIGDQMRLSQVLTNLLGNAVKFTEKGTVELKVTADGKTPDGRINVSFAVTDSGIGIPDNKRELLFQPFSQADVSNTRRFGGTGLGLAICKEIVELMGGVIDCNSQEGLGSVFTCIVPLGVTGTEHEPVAAVASTEHRYSVPVFADAATRPRLLIAEDDPIIQQLLGRIFKKANYDHDFAADGLTAVEKWENGTYDLILMDVQMPLMDGFKATAAIRGKEQVTGGHTAIIAMTAHTLKEDEERCIAAGMDAFISKPVDVRMCLDLIGEFVKKNKK
jgi:PAS domain S-box-containing protein